MRVKKKDAGSVSKKGLPSSLKASAKGVRRPMKEGLFGPRRNIIYESVFRSRRVKNATENKRLCNWSSHKRIIRSSKIQ